MWSVHFDICTSDIYCDKKVKWLGGYSMYVVISTVWRQQRLSQQAPKLCKLSSFPGFDISDVTYAIFSSWLFGIFVLRRYTSPRSKAS